MNHERVMDFLTGMALGFFLCGMISLVINSQLVTERNREAIKLGYAQYNPTNAMFEWRTNK